jgi:DNA-binding beta-propeller fold protein YncE
MLRYAILACAVALPADAMPHDDQEFVPPPAFARFDAAVGDVAPATAGHAYQTGSRIAALPDGALVIDADSGDLLQVDTAGALVAEIAIGKDAGLLAYDDSHRAYVADRRGDRIVVVDVGERLTIASTWHTPAEPYAVALSPDRSTVYATMIADQLVVAYDAATGRELWRASVGPEPRGLAIANGGTYAAVTSLTGTSLGEIDLGTHAVVHHALPAANELDHPRGAFAVTYLGDHVAVTAFESERPVPAIEEDTGHYGGASAFVPPIEHQLAFIDHRDRASRAVTDVHEPRALAWDPARDSLYVAGLASDNVVEIVHASQVDVLAGRDVQLRGKTRCGADGLAIAASGDVLVWCSLSRQVAHVRFAAATPTVQRGPELVASSLDARQHKGLELFHTADANISAFGAMSCGNCHLEGRSDGQSWLINGQRLQTPMLCGRIANTAPYKWNGDAPTLTNSLAQTVERLGGNGLAKRHLVALAAYLETMPPARAPTRDASAIIRGRILFESGELGCASCHEGPAYTDRQRHSLDGGPEFDTPSLIGVAHSAPYFHDGSAATLDVVLRDRGHVHGMSDGAALSDQDVADLKAFLESL